MQKRLSYLSFNRSFLIIFNAGSPSGTGCDEVRFHVHGCWDSRDVSVLGVFDCVKECMSFVM